MARDYYVNLYSKDVSVSCQPSDWSFPKLCRNAVKWLNREVTAYEIKIAVFNLGAHKARGWMVYRPFSSKSIGHELGRPSWSLYLMYSELV